MFVLVAIVSPDSGILLTAIAAAIEWRRRSPWRIAPGGRRSAERTPGGGNGTWKAGT
ncbi:MAG: hypothetical protein IPO75_02695 [Betaproteobacteria bacterium]|nr:hypothetical protein [Betaproteobacteria bacterium]